MLDESLIKTLPEEVEAAVLRICEAYREACAALGDSQKAPKNVDRYVTALGLLQAFVRAKRFNMGSIKINVGMTGIPAHDIETIHEVFTKTHAHAQQRLNQRLANETLEAAAQRFGPLIDEQADFEFTDDDLKRIQELTNQLRDLIEHTKELEDPHRERVLRRLEQFQQELHQKMSNMDRLWAFVGEAGVRLGQFGEDAKPFFDRIREVLDIVSRAATGVRKLAAPTSPLNRLLEHTADTEAPESTEE